MTGDRASAALRQAEVRLRAEWGRTAEVWRDEVAARFTKQYWSPLEQSIERYISSIEELEQALSEVEREAGG
jgi:hypothetical protein